MLSKLNVARAVGSLVRQAVKTHKHGGALWRSTAAAQVAEPVRRSEQYLQLEAPSRALRVDHMWLRDHCRCPECYLNTNERKLKPHSIADDIHPTDVTVDSDDLNVTWSDGHQSEYSISWLDENVYPGKAAKPPIVKPVLWNKEIIHSVNMPEVNFHDLVSEDDTGLRIMLTNLLRYGVSFIKDVPQNLEDTVKISSRISLLFSNHMGATWEFANDLSRGCQSMTSNPLGLHTDTCWLSQPAGLQVLHCLYHDGEGGHNQLMDGYHGAEILRVRDRAAFDFLATTPLYHEFHDDKAHVNSLDTVFRVHPTTGEVLQIRYKWLDRAPVSTVPQERIREYYRAQKAYAQIVEDPANTFEFKLYPGTAVIMDNQRVMHARSGFTGRRVMCGAYNPRDDWLGKARLMGLIY